MGCLSLLLDVLGALAGFCFPWLFLVTMGGAKGVWMGLGSQCLFGGLGVVSRTPVVSGASSDTLVR